MGEFPGQFTFDEILDMPEHLRYILHALAVRVGQKRMVVEVNAHNKGEIGSPYIDT